MKKRDLIALLDRFADDDDIAMDIGGVGFRYEINCVSTVRVNGNRECYLCECDREGFDSPADAYVSKDHLDARCKFIDFQVEEVACIGRDRPHDGRDVVVLGPDGNDLT